MIGWTIDGHSKDRVLDWIGLDCCALLLHLLAYCYFLSFRCRRVIVLLALGYQDDGFTRGLFISIYAANIAIYSAFNSTTTTTSTILTNSTLLLDTKDSSSTYSSLRTETVPTAPTVFFLDVILFIAHRTLLFISASQLLTNFPWE